MTLDTKRDGEIGVRILNFPQNMLNVCFKTGLNQANISYFIIKKKYLQVFIKIIDLHT